MRTAAPHSGQAMRRQIPPHDQPLGGSSAAQLHWPLHTLRANDKNGLQRPPPLRVGVPLSQQRPLRWSRLLLPALATLPAGPPVRLAARQGFVVNRSFRAAGGGPLRGSGRPSPGRALGGLVALPLLRAPACPVGPAPPRPLSCSGSMARGPLPPAAGLARFMAGGRPWCGFAAGGSGAGPFLPWSRCLVVVGGWGRGPDARPEAWSHHPDQAGLRVVGRGV